MTAVLFAVAVLVVPLALGLPLARWESLRGFSMPAKAAIAWSGGNVILAVLLTVFSGLGVAWRPWAVLVAAALAVGVTVRMPQRGNRSGPRSSGPAWPRRIAVGLCIVVAVATGVQLAAGAATSADLSYVWGAKASHFAIDRGMDFEWMRQPHLIHLHPNYPPLWPVVLAWGATISGSMPWTTVPILTLGYLIAAGLIVHALLRRPLGSRGAALVAGSWFAVLSGSILHSFSGGNAEGPLLLFVTVAVTVLVAENRDQTPTHRWLAAGALAGAVLTKSEGAVAAVLVISGATLRDVLWRRPGVVRASTRLASPALASVGLWIAIRIAHGLPLSDPIRETALHISFDNIGVILKVCTLLLGSGGLWVGWLAPLVAAAATRSFQPLRTLPGLLAVFGLPVFALVYYLHAAGNPVELIVWTFPRLIQPAISAWIVCLGIFCFSTGATPPKRDT